MKSKRRQKTLARKRSPPAAAAPPLWQQLLVSLRVKLATSYIEAPVESLTERIVHTDR